MREIFRTIKKHFILLLGMGLFTYGLFSFDSGYYLGKISLMPPPGIYTYPITTYYYYSDTSLILLTVGVIFIVIGLLKIKTQKVKIEQKLNG